MNDRGFFPWLLPASVGIHLAVLVALPSSSRPRGEARRATQVVIELNEPAPPPPPPPPAPAAPLVAEPVPSVPAALVVGVTRERVAPIAVAAPAAPAETSSDTPLDFTGGDGPGLAVRTTTARVAAPGPSGAPAVSVALPPPLVPLASLGRSPRPPGGLDAELERNYPPEARRSGISGTATLRVELRADGRVGRVDVTEESWAGFGAACARTLRGSPRPWDAPLDREGRPVRTEIKYVCRFEVRG